MQPLCACFDFLEKEIEKLRGRQTKTKAAKKSATNESLEGLPKHHGLLIVAIKRRHVLEFSYEGYARVVEPQTYGMSHTGKYVLRGHQIGGESRSGQPKIAKLFDVAKISKLQKSAEHFKEALRSHNPQASAMKLIFATLPKSSK